MQSWPDRHQEIARLTGRQLFFIGGAPRSGTTWLQLLLNSHPDVVCHGEGLFLNHFAVPLKKLLAERCQVLGDKNARLFAHTGGYPLPTGEDGEFLVGTAILLGLARQAGDRPCLAIGEKTPENVFFFPRLRQLFPAARFIAIARDPRDVVTSAWHFFPRSAPGMTVEAAKMAFIRAALPSLRDGARVMVAFADAHPEATRLLTYEGLRVAPEAALGALFRFLGVSDDPGIVADCVARAAFAAQTGGRAPGTAVDGAFFRTGVSGTWPGTLTPAMSDMILAELGWLFPRFGWQV